MMMDLFQKRWKVLVLSDESVEIQSILFILKKGSLKLEIFFVIKAHLDYNDKILNCETLEHETMSLYYSGKVVNLMYTRKKHYRKWYQQCWFNIPFPPATPAALLL